MGKSFANGKGSSHMNGQALGNGTAGFRSWESGWQAPPPVTIYDHLEGRAPE